MYGANKHFVDQLKPLIEVDKKTMNCKWASGEGNIKCLKEQKNK